MTDGYQRILNHAYTIRNNFIVMHVIFKVIKVKTITGQRIQLRRFGLTFSTSVILFSITSYFIFVIS